MFLPFPIKSSECPDDAGEIEPKNESIEVKQLARNEIGKYKSRFKMLFSVSLLFQVSFRFTETHSFELLLFLLTTSYFIG